MKIALKTTIALICTTLAADAHAQFTFGQDPNVVDLQQYQILNQQWARDGSIVIIGLRTVGGQVQSFDRLTCKSENCSRQLLLAMPVDFTASKAGYSPTGHIAYAASANLLVVLDTVTQARRAIPLELQYRGWYAPKPTSLTSSNRTLVLNIGGPGCWRARLGPKRFSIPNQDSWWRVYNVKWRLEITLGPGLETVSVAGRPASVEEIQQTFMPH